MRYQTSLRIKNLQRILLFAICDLIVVLFSIQMAHLLRHNEFDLFAFSFYTRYFGQIGIIVVSLFSVTSLLNCYAISWRYASGKDYLFLNFAVAVGTFIANLLTHMLVFNGRLFTKSDFIIIMLLCMLGYTAVRFMASVVRSLPPLREILKKPSQKKTRVLVVSGGDTGSSIIRKLQHEGEKYPVAIVDNDPRKHGMRISGVPVVGSSNEIERVCKENKIKEIIIAIPETEEKEREELVRKCRATGLKILSVPTYDEIMSGKVKLSQMREITPQELLERDEQLIDGEEVFNYIGGKTVLVTGGGGSIGSELCRQIAKFKPKRLIIFDIYENNAYELQLELKRKYPELKLEVLIGSVRDRERLDLLFEKYKPKVIFHAAAHKHVPLMEDSPEEAIKNNIYGTYNVALMSEKHAVERFVLISTDKAVNPLNIMGASKRIAEMVMQQFALRQRNSGGKTIYAAVRFGNVLGSNGSVLPLFKQQIKNGGPITITHPEINRFFMTIPEAAQLVMQAGAFADGGEIFILDMGEPVKIVDLARNLIELSGYVPDVDIKIEYVGLRPGEKLYEELLLDKQRQAATKHNRIFVEPPVEDMNSIVNEIYALREKLTCEVEGYEQMISWFKENFAHES